MKNVVEFLSKIKDRLPVQDSAVRVMLLRGNLRLTVDWMIDGRLHDWNREITLRAFEEGYEPHMLEMFIEECIHHQNKTLGKI